MAVTLRPMTKDDGRAVLGLMAVVFADLDRRMNREPFWPVDPAPGLVRMHHLLGTDPDGCWVAEDGDGRIVGNAIAILREDLWGLSLFIVHPEHQGTGVGRGLLEQALAHGPYARGGIILSSPDPRALRSYARAGFQLRPTVDAKGVVRSPLERPPAVREGRWPDDRPLLDAVSRHVRGAAHGEDLGALIASGARLLVDERGAFALVRNGEIKVLAAREDALAAGVLRAALATRAPGEEGSVEFIAAGHDWAIEVVHEAGLDLVVNGAIFTRGEVGPLAPYLPSGSYL